MRREKLAVIADDITGAGDSGIQFKKSGYSVAVSPSVDAVESLSKTFDVVVIDTESRALEPDQAYKAVATTTKKVKELGIGIVFKKIDSTLRGNIGQEVDAILDLTNSFALLCPSYPAYGRTVVNSILLIDGVPITDTHYSRDPVHPITDSYIPKLLEKQTRHLIGALELKCVREGKHSFERRIELLREKGCRLVVVDAESDEDLRLIGSMALESGALAVGSAGLAEGVSKSLSTPKFKPILTICGSVNPKSLEQIDFAHKETQNSDLIIVNAKALLTEGNARELEVSRVVKEALYVMAKRRDLFILTASTPFDVDSTLSEGRRLGLDEKAVGRTISHLLGLIALRIVKSNLVGGIFLTGGDIAVHVLQSLGADGLELEEEVSPGIPMTKVIGGEFEGLRVVTKAGGFGGKSVIFDLISDRRLWNRP